MAVLKGRTLTGQMNSAIATPSESAILKDKLLKHHKKLKEKLSPEPVEVKPVVDEKAEHRKRNKEIMKELRRVFD